MNKRGHEIKYLFMSGGLVKNGILMQLLADICSIPIQLPFSHSASVVLGSAMLGAIAAQEVSSGGKISSQEEAEKRGRGMADELWKTMEKMSRPGTTVLPKAGDKEKKLLEVKYKIFHDLIKTQRQYRKDVEEALA
jgi:ribulose kinase